jgi:hypothetical protein
MFKEKKDFRVLSKERDKIGYELIYHWNAIGIRIDRLSMMGVVKMFMKHLNNSQNIFWIG